MFPSPFFCKRGSIMNQRYTACILLLLAFTTTAAAQVASHAPTVFTPKPTSSESTLTPMTPTGKPVAHVNGTTLTEADLVREEYAIFPYARQHDGIPKELAPEIRDGAMKMLIFEELVYQEALRRKMTVPSAKIQQAEKDFQKTFANPEDFNAFMQSEFHGSRQLLDEKIQRSLLIDALLKIEIQNRSTVSPTEVRAYYDKNPGRFQIPESFIFQTITVLVPEKATAEQIKEARERADKELPQAKAAKTNNDFGLLAEKVSDDDYRVMEGQHKSTPLSQLPPQVVKVFRTMKPGDVSGVIQVGADFTILRLNARTPAGEQKFIDVKAKLAKDLQQYKTNQLRAALDQKLRQGARIEEP
jgi:peptidyl-prolyl cis-trans isomerase SurA